MYKIMFVDDEEQNLLLMEKIVDWEELGFRVCGIALDGTEGIQVFEETRPDVVFVDIRMEEMDGLTLIEKLKENYKDVIFVIVTAYDEFSYAQKAITLGVKNYLLKPIARKEMIPMMEEIREELDAETRMKQKEEFLNHEYAANVFQKAFETLEKSYLEHKELSELPEIDQIMEGKTYWYFELVSSTDTVEELKKIIREWNVDYLIQGYDSVYGVLAEENRGDILEAFGTLAAHNLKRKYILFDNGSFANGKELCAVYDEDYARHKNYYYLETTGKCSGEEKEAADVQKQEKTELSGTETAVHELIYNGSDKEIQALVKNYMQLAKERKIVPDEVADQMIEWLILIKSQLTKLYQDRAFMVLRHQNVWDLHRIRTAKKLEETMAQQLADTAQAVRDILENKGNYSLMGKTTDYIWKNFSNPEFSATEVADEVHLSRNYFLKMFKEKMGIAFGDYVTNIRMEKAKKLLKHTEDTVYTISRSVGYESQYHFSRKFKAMYGISPNEYRKL